MKVNTSTKKKTQDIRRKKLNIFIGEAVVTNISKNLGKEKLTFMADRTLENVLNNMHSLGDFGEETHAYTAQFEGEYNIGLSTGKRLRNSVAFKTEKSITVEICQTAPIIDCLKYFCLTIIKRKEMLNRCCLTTD